MFSLEKKRHFKYAAWKRDVFIWARRSLRSACAPFFSSWRSLSRSERQHAILRLNVSVPKKKLRPPAAKVFIFTLSWCNFIAACWLHIRFFEFVMYARGRTTSTWVFFHSLSLSLYVQFISFFNDAFAVFACRLAFSAQQFLWCFLINYFTGM